MSQPMKYVSEVYTRLWDEMMCQQKLHMKCFVVSDSSLCNYMPLEKVLALPGVSAVIVNENSRDRILEIVQEQQIKNIDVIGFSVGSCFGEVQYFDAEDECLRQFDCLAVGGTFDRCPPPPVPLCTPHLIALSI